MKYSPGRDGKGYFSFGSGEVDIIFNTLEGKLLASFVDALLKIKAIQEFIVREEVVNPQVQNHLEEVIANVRGLYKENQNAYDRYLELKQLNTIPLNQVPQADIIIAFNGRNIDLVLQLCAGVAQG